MYIVRVIRIWYAESGVDIISRGDFLLVADDPGKERAVPAKKIGYQGCEVLVVVWTVVLYLRGVSGDGDGDVAADAEGMVAGRGMGCRV